MRELWGPAAACLSATDRLALIGVALSRMDGFDSWLRAVEIAFANSPWKKCVR